MFPDQVTLSTCMHLICHIPGIDEYICIERQMSEDARPASPPSCVSASLALNVQASVADFADNLLSRLSARKRGIDQISQGGPTEELSAQGSELTSADNSGDEIPDPCEFLTKEILAILHEDLHPAAQLYDEHSPGDVWEAVGLNGFLREFGGFPSTVYIRSEDTVVIRRVVSRLAVASNAKRCTGIVGSAGVGKSAVLMTVCLTLWQKHGRNLYIVRIVPDGSRTRFAVVMLKGEKALTTTRVGVLDHWWQVCGAYEWFKRSCDGAILLAADGWDKGRETYLDCYLRSMCHLYSCSNFNDDVDAVHDDLFLVSGWRLAELADLATKLSVTCLPELQYAFSGGNLSAFLGQRKTAVCDQAAKLSDTDLDGTPLLVTGAACPSLANPLYRVYNTATDDPHSCCDRSRWCVVLDVGDALTRCIPNISVPVYAASLAWVLCLNSDGNDKVCALKVTAGAEWAHSALLGHMHRLAYEGRLIVEVAPYCSPLVKRGGNCRGTRYAQLSAEERPVWVRSGMGLVDCLQQLSQEYRPGEISYWLPEEWEDSPIDAVMYCGGMCCALMLKATLTAEVDIDTADLKKAHDALVASLPSDWVVQLMVVLPAVVSQGFDPKWYYKMPDEIYMQSGVFTSAALIRDSRNIDMDDVERIVGNYRESH
jgi:hypothetical protein